MTKKPHGNGANCKFEKAAYTSRTCCGRKDKKGPGKNQGRDPISKVMDKNL